MAKLQHIDKRAHTCADAATVYALLLDRATWPAWSALESFEPETDGVDGPNSLGAIGTFVTGKTRSREELVELVPERRLSYALLSGLPLVGYRADIDLSATADGGTDIRWHSTFTPARPGTGWIFRLALGRFITKCVHGLAAATATAETSAPDAAPAR